MVSLKSGDKELELREVAIGASIGGGFARAEVLLTFFNGTSGKVVEGELDFPLPPNATVCGYALEDNDTERLIPASVVGKEKARITFEQEVRSGGTASLVEVVKGNSFKIHVYPLVPNHQKRVLVSFVTPLKSTGGDEGLVALTIPYKTSRSVVRATFDIRVHGHPSLPSPNVVSSLAGLSFSPKQPDGVSVLISVLNGVKLEPVQITIRIPPPGTPASVNLFAKESETFFVVEDFPVLPTADPEPATAGSKSSKFLVMSDASFSSSSSKSSA